MPTITKTVTLKSCALCDHYLTPGHFRAFSDKRRSPMCRRCELANERRHKFHGAPAELVADVETVFDLIAGRPRGASRATLCRKLPLHYAIVRDDMLHTLAPAEREADRVGRLDAALSALLDLGHIEDANDHYHTVVNPVWLNPPAH